MWKQIKPYFAFCRLIFDEKFKPIRRHKAMKYVSILFAFILGVVVSNFLGIPWLDLVKPIFRILSYQWWIIIGLLVVIAFWMLLLDGARKYHERIVRELSADFQTRAWNIQKLSFVNGCAERIDRLQMQDKEVPREMYEEWSVNLKIALHHCYGKDGIFIFNNGNSDKIVVPDDPYVWFSMSHSRLSQLITEQIQAQSIAHTSTNQKQ
jgi:hypothetical protein